MSRELIEVLILAAVAVVVIGRFFSVLGQRRGSDRPEAPQQAPQPATVDAGLVPQPIPSQPSVTLPPAASVGVASILAVDPAFNPAAFVAGARSAYELIVTAFAAGDRAALGPLLSPRVFESYANAITVREAEGGKGPELVRLKTAEITEARVEDSMARIAVRFEAELAEGAHGIRETKERWTFERDTRSRDPNWRLAGVAQA
ncbi:MAG: Tim44 domain-containing protein [Hyphomonadaceae bacterium]|nr:MAG: Tim44 domain-containing protein [Caulobacteraceae bacterium]MBT9444516.1 Tim44 domain-containing protein [Hyphomonadaceae bacterium]TPW07821.1 MAG: Tim44 domain-containing protein [Alphaproteobacteria bacterium]